MKKTKIIGWDFNRNARRGLNADGSSSLEILKSEKTRLERRYVDIPKQITQIKQSIATIEQDKAWLSSLSNRQKRKWEEDHGANVEQTLRTMATKITELKARITSLVEERKRIPQQLESVQQQLDALVKGEATGLEQGLDKESAKELGELALESEREKMEHERAIREAEIEKQQLEAQQKQGSNQTKVWVILGVAAILAIIAFVVYKTKFASKIQAS